MSFVPEGHERAFWPLERKTFAQPSEGGSVAVLRCSDRTVATTICIRDQLNRTTLIRWHRDSGTSVAWRVSLDEKAISLLLDTVGSALEPNPITMGVGEVRDEDGGAGYGLFVYMTEYPEEGVILLAELPRPVSEVPEVMDLHGVRRDGSMSGALAKAGLSPAIKMKEIAQEFFGPLPTNEDSADSSDTGMCLAAIEQFYEWLQKQATLLGGPIDGGQP